MQTVNLLCKKGAKYLNFKKITISVINVAINFCLSFVSARFLYFRGISFFFFNIGSKIFLHSPGQLELADEISNV